MAKEEKSSVERLKGRLYARDSKKTSTQERTPLSPEGHEAPVSWTTPEDENVGGDNAAHIREPHISGELMPRMSFATKFLIGSVVFFVAASGAAAYMFFGGGNIVSSRNIGLEIVAPSLIDAGKEASLQILITNNNRTALRLADLIIDYPDGTRDPKDTTRTFSHERISVGTIESGEQTKQTAAAVFFGQEGTEQNVHVTLEYTITGSNAVFVKEGYISFIIGSSPVSLSVEAPNEAIAGEPFDMEVTVQSNAATAVEHVVVEAQYPFGFSFLGSNPRADVGGLLWRLGTMEPGDSKTITITGVVDASEGDERVLRFLIGSDADETNTRIRVPFLSQPITLTVKQPFIASSIAVDGKEAKTISAPAGKTLQGTVEWQNNLSESISDVELALSFDGPMLNGSSVSAQNGFYQSGNKTITWTKAHDPGLSQVPPGGGGTLFFSFATLVPGSGDVIYSNPTIDLQLTVRATRHSEGETPQNVSSAASTQVVLSSALFLEARALHFTGAFSNTGPMPPKPDTQTSYTIVWAVKNSSNAIANTAVAAVLPPYMKFVAAIPGSNITYDEGSRTVRWALGDLAAGVGYSLPSREGSFQVALTPSDSQSGQAPALTGTAVLSGQDRFAQVPVQASAEGPTTQLDEKGFNSSMGIVE